MNIHTGHKKVFDCWHKAVVERDIELLMSNYANDAILETPAIVAVWPHRGEGILRGKQEITMFFEASFLRALAKDFGGWWRTGEHYSEGKLLMWEYPRECPAGSQLDLVESMDIECGLIKHHRVYWGWKGFMALTAAIANSRA